MQSEIITESLQFLASPCLSMYKLHVESCHTDTLRFRTMSPLQGPWFCHHCPKRCGRNRPPAQALRVDAVAFLLIFVPSCVRQPRRESSSRQNRTGPKVMQRFSCFIRMGKSFATIRSIRRSHENNKENGPN